MIGIDSVVQSVLAAGLIAMKADRDLFDYSFAGLTNDLDGLWTILQTQTPSADQIAQGFGAHGPDSTRWVVVLESDEVTQQFLGHKGRNTLNGAETLTLREHVEISRPRVAIYIESPSPNALKANYHFAKVIMMTRRTSFASYCLGYRRTAGSDMGIMDRPDGGVHVYTRVLRYEFETEEKCYIAVGKPHDDFIIMHESASTEINGTVVHGKVTIETEDQFNA